MVKMKPPEKINIVISSTQDVVVPLIATTRVLIMKIHIGRIIDQYQSSEIGNVYESGVTSFFQW